VVTQLEVVLAVGLLWLVFHCAGQDAFKDTFCDCLRMVHPMIVAGTPLLRRTDKNQGMPTDLTPTPETEMIRIYVKVLAPGIHEVSCGTRLDGGYELWLQLNPTSTIKQVVISQAEYKADQWKARVDDAIEEINI